MQRSKKSILNAVAAMLFTLMNGLFSIIVTRLVIVTFGSDFNGLNSTASQLVNIILLIEGGFTIATNVAMFRPYHDKDYPAINGILSATYRKFKKIGVIFLGVGAFVATGYTFIVNSNLPSELIFTTMLMAIVPAAFNLYYAMKYRILLQADQKEYVISFISLLTVSAGHIINIIAIQNGGQMWMIRASTMLMALINSLLIGFYVKRSYKYIDFKTEPNFDAIKGTNDVLIQKITGVIYDTAPIIFISISPDGGTMLASVYAVYNNVFTLLKGVMQGIIDAPRLGFGEMVASKEREEVWPTFKLYQFIVLIALFVVLVTAAVLIMPFVTVYSQGVSDANYQQPLIALLMVGIMLFQMIHIPSGHLINMSGKFKISRQIQTVATIFLLITMAIGVFINGIYGILVSVLLTAILLAVFEIGYIHLQFFSKKLKSFFRLFLPFVIAAIPLGILEYSLLPEISGYLELIISAVILVCINGLIGMGVGMIFNKKSTSDVLNRVLNILRLKK
ncbi:MAG: hypothetical protein ACOX3W_08390 [Christensenellaceae bacterium]